MHRPAVWSTRVTFSPFITKCWAIADPIVPAPTTPILVNGTFVTCALIEGAFVEDTFVEVTFVEGKGDLCVIIALNSFDQGR